MKNLFGLWIILVLSASCSHKGASHYNSFPKTAAVPYQEAVLDFYSTKDPYGEFSNFALFPVFVDGEWWPTSEHYYQAHKYENIELQKWVQSAPTPMEAALRGRDKNIEKRSDWEQRKDEFMEKAVWDKFTRYPELAELLLSTGSARLYEHTKNDCYWGDCGDRTGKNKLGLLLEKIRSALQKSTPL
ncbi:NADAR family protein [uncultured Bdellovibrio sp.]|uniref:NADAR family protein n=1 Tax=Bdellovibrio sp. HCB-162 TaxID=3394234 RepID=UPI0025EA3E78|nr:NADAR family protein [uncultured Bdellovibrio sp.]